MTAQADKFSAQAEKLSAHAVRTAERLDRLGEHLNSLDVWTRVEPTSRKPRFTRDEIAVKLLEAAGQAVPDSKPHFELNAAHPLLLRLDAESDEDQFRELAFVLLDQARLAEGGQLPDPGAFVSRLNRLLLSLAGRAA